MELDNCDLGVLHSGGSPGGVADLLVKDETFHELGVVDGAAELLHDLHISEVDHVGLGAIDDGENGVDS